MRLRPRRRGADDDDAIADSGSDVENSGDDHFDEEDGDDHDDKRFLRRPARRREWNHGGDEDDPNNDEGYGRGRDASSSDEGRGGGKGGKSRFVEPAQEGPSPPTSVARPLRKWGEPLPPPPPIDERRYGLGSAILRSMGWTGGALESTTGAGIPEPLDMKPRPEAQGLGFNNFDEKSASERRIERALRRSRAHDGETCGSDGSDIDADGEVMELEKGDRTDGRLTRQTRRRRRRVALTAQQLLARAEAAGAVVSVEPELIDMTGAEPRLVSLREAVSNDDGLGSAEPPSDIGRALLSPALQYNMQHLVALREAELLALHRRKAVAIECRNRARRELAEARAEEDAQAERERALTEIERLLAPVTDGSAADAAGVAEALAEVRERFPREYVALRLHEAATSAAAVAIRAAADAWAPFERASERGALAAAVSRARSAAARADPYGEGTLSLDAAREFQAAAEAAAAPGIRAQFTQRWDSRDADAGVQVFASLEEQLGRAAMDAVFDDAVLPRLRMLVSSWQCDTEPCAALAALGPWQSLRAETLRLELWPLVRERILDALRRWRPSQTWAHAAIRSWARVWEPATLRPLVQRGVLPVLERALSSLADETSLAAAAEWTDIVPLSEIALAVDRGFFGAWLRHIASQLHARKWSGPDCAAEYLRWRNAMPPALLAVARVQERLAQVLVVMKRHVRGDSHAADEALRIRVGVPDEALPRWDDASPAVAQSAAAAKPSSIAALDGLSLRELLERLAARCDFVLSPRRPRADGVPLYNFGAVPIALQRGEIVAQAATGDWRPIELEELLARAAAAR